MKHIKTYNESIKHLLKPKNKEEIRKDILNSKSDNKTKLERILRYQLINLFTEEEILKLSKNIPKVELLKIGSEYNIISLIKKALKPTSFLTLSKDTSKIDDEIINYSFSLACSNNNIDIVKYFLNNVISNPSFTGNKSLIKSSSSGNLEIVKLLLNHENFKINNNSDITNVISSALLNGHFHIIDYLLKDNRFKNIRHPEIIIERINHNKEYLKKILQYDEIIKNLPSYSKFNYGCKLNILSLVKQSIDEGEKPELPFHMVIRGERNKIVSDHPISIAVKNGYFDIIKYIIDNTDFDPSEYNNILIRIAYNNKHHKIVDILLRDRRVTDKLENYEIDFYENEVGHLYESIRHLLKNNKTEVDIRKIMKKTYTQQGKKFMAAQYDLVWLIDEIIKECDLDSNRDLGYIFNIAVGFNSINVINYLIKHWNLKFQSHNLYSAIQNNNFELMKLIFDSEHIENIDIDECIKYADNTDILSYLYNKKNINESIKHLLKPKSEGDILNSIKYKSNTEKYLISLINDIDWLYNMTKDDVKTVQISIDEFNKLSHSSYLLFNIREKEKINSNINRHLKGKRSYYLYDETYSLYINHINGWKINNYGKYILLSVNLRRDNHLYYICPNIDELINLLNKYNIKARQYDPIEKEFIDV